MRILGLSAFGHDSAAALVGDAGVEAAVEESKLLRARGAGGIPRAAIRFCLDSARAGWTDLACVAVASRPLRAWVRRAMLRTRFTPLAPVSSGYYQSKAFGELGRELNNLRILDGLKDNPACRLISLDHHLCHAASAFYGSPFDRALILSLDEQGDGRSGLAALGDGIRIRPIARIAFPHSPAWVFTQVTELLGFEPHRSEHKTQWLGLSADPVLSDLFFEMMRGGHSPAPHLKAEYFTRGFAGSIAFSKKLYSRIGVAPGRPVADPALRAQLAASVQHACGRVAAEYLEWLRRRTAARFACLAGGLFLNPVIVAAVERDTAFDGLFVQPAAGNEGTALGAAWHVGHALMGRPRRDPPAHLYWGPAITNQDAKQVLDNCKSSYHWLESDDQRIAETLRLLEAGKIVAWVQGPAEFGPRALGNRSLLASPWAPYVRENLNEFVKHREAFRPFAVSVTEEAAPRFFELTSNARFLSTLSRLRTEHIELLEGFLLPGARVRLHVVSRATNPALWALLDAFGRRAPAPLLVNTSFNLFGEPLVLSPRDAVRSFFCSGIDAMVLGSFLLEKS